MVQIYWNTYDFKPNKKYLIYYFGNFSPPHKGHYSLIEPFLSQKESNIKILIDIFGDESRHGISKEISLKIFQIYLKNYTNFSFSKDNIDKNIDKVIFIRGKENYNIKKFVQEYHSDFIKKLRKQGILSDILIIDRISSISSTEMCKNINSELYLTYLPEHILNDEKEEIILLLRNLLKN